MLQMIQMGLGPIGLNLAREISRRPGMRLVAAADPKMAGQSTGDLLSTERDDRVYASVDQALESVAADVVVHAAGSFLDRTAGQLFPLLERGLHVVSTCEELSFPYYRHPELAARLDAAAVKGRCVLLGTGINPGFAMDKLVATLMAASSDVEEVRVLRVVDATKRRGPFQKKIGAGMSEQAFEAAAAAGGMGHVGLAESAHLVGEAMGMGRDRTLKESLRPVLADRRRSTPHVEIEPGVVAGVHQIVDLTASGGGRVRMELRMYVGAEDPQDSVSIVGMPPLEMTIPAGLEGDRGTINVTVSCLPLVRSLSPGLRTMLDVPVRPPGNRLTEHARFER